MSPTKGAEGMTIYNDDGDGPCCSKCDIQILVQPECDWDNKIDMCWECQAKRIHSLEAALRFCAGYISTTKGHTHEHPEEVLDWIMKQTEFNETSRIASVLGEEGKT